MGRARGDKKDHAGEPVPGRGVWPSALDELQEIGGMSSAWHARNHLVQDALGEVQIPRTFPWSPIFEDAPQHLLEDLEKRPLTARERIAILDSTEPGQQIPRSDPVLQALWENEWQHLLEEDLVDLYKKEEIQNLWYHDISEAQLDRKKSETHSYEDSLTGLSTSVLWTSIIRMEPRNREAIIKEWDGLAGELMFWAARDPAAARQFLQEQVFGYPGHFRTMQYELGKTEAAPSRYFCQSIWEILEDRRLDPGDPLYSPESYSLDSVLSAIRGRVRRLDAEAVDAFEKRPLYSSCPGVAKDQEGGGSPVYAFALEALCSQAHTLSIKDMSFARSATVAASLVRLLHRDDDGHLDVSEEIDAAVGLRARYAEACNKFQKEGGSHPLSGWDFLFVQNPGRWEEVKDKISEREFAQSIDNLERVLRGVRWTEDLEKDLLECLEEEFLQSSS